MFGFSFARESIESTKAPESSGYDLTFGSENHDCNWKFSRFGTPSWVCEFSNLNKIFNVGEETFYGKYAINIYDNDYVVDIAGITFPITITPNSYRLRGWATREFTIGTHNVKFEIESLSETPEINTSNNTFETTITTPFGVTSLDDLDWDGVANELDHCQFEVGTLPTGCAANNPNTNGADLSITHIYDALRDHGTMSISTSVFNWTKTALLCDYQYPSSNESKKIKNIGDNTFYGTVTVKDYIDGELVRTHTMYPYEIVTDYVEPSNRFTMRCFSIYNYKPGHRYHLTREIEVAHGYDANLSNNSFDIYVWNNYDATDPIEKIREF